MLRVSKYIEEFQCFLYIATLKSFSYGLLTFEVYCMWLVMLRQFDHPCYRSIIWNTIKIHVVWKLAYVRYLSGSPGSHLTSAGWLLNFQGHSAAILTLMTKRTIFWCREHWIVHDTQDAITRNYFNITVVAAFLFYPPPNAHDVLSFYPHNFLQGNFFFR